MIKFKLNGKTIDFASTWDDVSFKQYLQIIKISDDVIKLVSVLGNIDYEILKKSTISGLEDIITVVSFIRKPPILPEKVTEIGGYKLPVNSSGGFNIQFESLAQFEDMRHIMMSSKNSSEDISDNFVSYVSIYLQKIKDGEYDSVKAELMREEVLDMPAPKVIALGGFFLARLLTLSSGTIAKSQNTTQNTKKSKLVMKGSQKRSDTSARSSKRR